MIDIDCDYVLKLLAIFLGTLFWMWFLVFENEQRANEAKKKRETEDKNK